MLVTMRLFHDALRNVSACLPHLHQMPPMIINTADQMINSHDKKADVTWRNERIITLYFNKICFVHIYHETSHDQPCSTRLGQLELPSRPLIASAVIINLRVPSGRMLNMDDTSFLIAYVNVYLLFH